MATSSVWIESKRASLADALRRLGQVGFAIQLVFLVAVVILGGYTFFVTGSAREPRIGNILSYMVLLIPVFTTFWCRRYATTGTQMKADPAKPTPAGLRRTLWIGVWAGTAGAASSLLSLFGAASALMFTMLSNPQIGIQVAPGPGTPSSYTISAFDGVSIMSLLLTLTAELLVVFLSLRLIFLAERATRQPAGT